MSNFDATEILKSSDEEISFFLENKFYRYRVEILKKLLEQGRIDLLEKLISSPISISTKQCILWVASNNENINLVKFSLDKGVNPNFYLHSDSPLLNACEKGNIELINILLDSGANINIGCKLPYSLDVDYEMDEDCIPALDMVCIKSKRLDIVKLLIERGADVNLVAYGMNPILSACSAGNLKFVKFLLEKGATLTPDNEGEFKGFTPLHYAAESKNVKLVKFILKRGGDVNAKSDRGISVLRMACDRGSIKIVRLLLERGANINENCSFENSPLKAAMDEDRRKVINELLSYGIKNSFTSILPENEKKVNKIFEDFEKKMGNIKGSKKVGN